MCLVDRRLPYGGLVMMRISDSGFWILDMLGGSQCMISCFWKEMRWSTHARCALAFAFCKTLVSMSEAMICLSVGCLIYHCEACLWSFSRSSGW